MSLRSLRTYLEDAAEQLAQPSGAAAAGHGTEVPRPPKRLDLVLQVQRMSVRTRLHPLESFLATHAQALRATRAKSYLWDDLVRQTYPAAAAREEARRHPPPTPAAEDPPATTPNQKPAPPSTSKGAGRVRRTQSDADGIGLRPSAASVAAVVASLDAGGGLARRATTIPDNIDWDAVTALTADDKTPLPSQVQSAFAGQAVTPPVATKEQVLEEEDVQGRFQASLASEYIAYCRGLAAASERSLGASDQLGGALGLARSLFLGSFGSHVGPDGEPECPCPDSLLLEADSLHALIVQTHCKGGYLKEEAVEFVREVDPPSQQQDFTDIKTIHLDVQLGGFSAKGAGMLSPLGCWKQGRATGLVVQARQVALTPEYQQVPVQLGQRVIRQLELPRRGARAPPKYYTDIMTELEGLGVGYSVASEPVLAAISRAVKRINPPGPLGVPHVSLPGLAPEIEPDATSSLPWWDTMRYIWRGSLVCHVAGAAVEVGMGPHAEISGCKERLLLEAEHFRLAASAGRCHLGLDKAQISALRPESLAQLLPSGGWILLADFPQWEVDVRLMWHIVGGRNPLDHFLHHRPPQGPAPIHRRHGPVEVTELYQAVGWDLTLHHRMGERKTLPKAGGRVAWCAACMEAEAMPAGPRSFPV